MYLRFFGQNCTGTLRDESNWGIFDANGSMTDIFSNVTKVKAIYFIS